MRQIFKALFIASFASIWLVQPASAFSVNGGDATTNVGACDLAAFRQFEEGLSVGVAVFSPGAGLQIFLDYRSSTNTFTTKGAAFTAAQVETICNVEDVQNFVLVEPNPALTFAQHSEISVSFSYTDPSDDLRYVARAAIEGVTSTTATASSVADPAPAPVISGLAATVGLAGDSVTIDFGEEVSGFTLSDLTLSSTLSASNLQTSDNTTYTFDVVATATGSGSIALPPGVVQDTAASGNLAAGAVATNTTIDRPEFTFIRVTPSGSFPGRFVAEFEAPAGAVATTVSPLAVISATNATVIQTLRAGADLDVTFTPTADGPVTLTIGAELLAAIPGGNRSLAQGPIDLGTFDSTPPTASIAAFTGPLNGDQTTLITLSEDAADFTGADLTLTNATATLTGSGSNYTAVLTPIADGPVSLFIDARTFTDAAGNGNTASDLVTTTFDGTAPTITIADLTGPVDGVYTAAITLSEDAADFTVDDLTLTLTNATATLTGSGTSYTAVLTPSADGPVSLSIDALTFTDAAGNGNAASDLVTTTFDGTAPTVIVTSSTDSFVGTTPFAVTVAFSEPVTGFAADDLVVANGVASAVTGGDADYEVIITPTGAGDITITVPAGVATDTSGNANVASAQVSVAGQTTQMTQERIVSFMQSRATALVANQPNLSGLLGRPNSSFDAAVTKGRGTFDLTSRTDGPVWAQVTGSFARNDSSQSTYVLGIVGTHYQRDENLLIGAMVQLDYAEETTGASAVSGLGWLAGPYIVARSATQPLIFEGSVLYGRSSNDISPFGTYSDTFTTERVLTSAKLSGWIERGDIIWQPSLGLSYVLDAQDAYTDSLNNVIGAQTIEMTEAVAGFDFVNPLSDAYTLTGGINGIYSQSSGTGGQASVLIPSTDGLRGRTNFGLDYTSDNGMSSNISVFYDGFGTSGYEAFGVNASMEFRF